MTYRAFRVQTPLDSWSDPIFDDGGQERGAVHPERLVFMRRHLRLLGLPRLGLALGLLALLASEVKADLSVNGLGLSDGAKASKREAQSTGNSGSLGLWRRPDATNWTFPNGSSIPLDCIDLTHDNAVGKLIRPLVGPGLLDIQLSAPPTESPGPRADRPERNPGTTLTHGRESPGKDTERGS